MKKIFLLFTLLMANIVIASPCKKADKETAQMRYELQAAVGQASEGSAMVRVWTYSKKAKIAKEQAGKNAVHGILFKGYPSLNHGNTRIVGREALISDASIWDTQAAYWQEFFKEGGSYQRYVSYIANGTPDFITKVNKEYKIGIVVIVQVEALRKRLQEDGILPKDEVKGKMPIIMVVPSSTWCSAHGYMKQGAPDYEQALLHSQELNQAITTLSVRLNQRGFEIKDLNNALRTMRNEAAEEAVTVSQFDDKINETPLDQLRRTAKADIWIEIDWYINELKGGSQQSLTWSMSAIDAYTDIVIGGVSPTTTGATYASSFQLPIMVESAIQGQFDPFCNTLIDYFHNIEQKGRAVKLNILTWEILRDGLQTEIDDLELSDIIIEWLDKNTVNGKYGTPELNPSGNRMTIEQVRVPLVNAKGKDLSTLSWIKGLQKWLMDEYDMESNVSTKGLGQVQIILGGK